MPVGPFFPCVLELGGGVNGELGTTSPCPDNGGGTCKIGEPGMVRPSAGDSGPVDGDGA